MAYQNNNNRIVPKAVEDRQLKPTATVQNKLIKYNPDSLTGSFMSSSGRRWLNTGKALADLGTGVSQLDTYWQKTAQENAIKAVWETEAKGGNKKQWADVSKNIQGAAKFNPYNDDEYRKLQSQDITRVATEQLVSTPEIEKVDPDKFYQIVTDTTKQVMDAYKETGLSPKDYGDSLVQWDKSMKTLENKYIERHAEYSYKQLAIKEASDLSYNASVSLFDNKNMDKSVVLRGAIDSKIQEMSELGIPADTQAGIILSGLKGFLAKNADSVSAAEFRMAVDDLSVDGKKLRDVVPDYDYQVQQLYKAAQRAIYEDKELDYRNHELDMKIAGDNAMKDLYNWTKQHPDAPFSDVLAETQSIVQKWGLEENGFNIISQMASSKKTLMDMNEVISDPRTLQDLAAEAAAGTLSSDRVQNLIRDGVINWRDGLPFVDRITRQQKEAGGGSGSGYSANFKTNFNMFHKQCGKTGLYGQELGVDSDTVKELNGQANQLMIDWSNGKITSQQANKGLQDLERIGQAKIKIKQNKNRNESLLMNVNWIRSQAAPSFNSERAIKAFKQLGLERGKVGQKIQPIITSAPNDHRVVNGKRSPHRGYDLGATTQTRVHSAPAMGRVIYAGKDSGFGNYAVIRYGSGANACYMRVGHLSTSTAYLRGKVLGAGAYIGRAGSTGYSTGVHVHVDFWNANKEIISAEQFQRLCR